MDMDEQAQNLEMRRAVAVLINMAENTTPRDFRSMLGATVANVVGALPDWYWKQMMMPAPPCQTPGCNCQDLANKFMEEMDVMRTDHIHTIAKRATSN